MKNHKCEFKIVCTRFLSHNKAEYWRECECGSKTELQSFQPAIKGSKIIFEPANSNTGEPMTKQEKSVDEVLMKYTSLCPSSLASEAWLETNERIKALEAKVKALEGEIR